MPFITNRKSSEPKKTGLYLTKNLPKLNSLTFRFPALAGSAAGGWGGSLLFGLLVGGE